MIRASVVEALDRPDIDDVGPMVIGLGYSGPTDCCVMLSLASGQGKEYGVESPAWELLSDIVDLIHNGNYPATITDPELLAVCRFIWRHRDADIRKGDSNASL